MAGLMLSRKECKLEMYEDGSAETGANMALRL